MNYRSSILCIIWISLLYCTFCAKQDIIQDDPDCPPWFVYNTSTRTCECYSSPSTDHIVKCTEEEALLKRGYCMTYEEKSGFFVGRCENAAVSSLNVTQDKYIRLPSNVSDLNDYMCEPMNRKGRMCGQCIDGFGLAVFSVEQVCTNCSGVWYGVPLYLFIEFVPITIFYFIVMFFHINVTSAPMVAFVFYSQIAISSFSHISNKLIFDTMIIYHFLKVLVSLYGIWNLDFFRIMVPPFCVSPLFKPIHITFLYFISAIYPLCLISLSWFCVYLHSRNLRPIVCLRNKLNQILNFFTLKLNATKTMTDVFATFFLLSYAKLVYVSLKSLYCSSSLNLILTNISLQHVLHVESDPNMKYFGTEHLPFAFFSLFIFLFIVIPIPVLLALYPVRCFRTIVFKCPVLGSRARAAINIFVQRFYNCFRDSTGSEGGRDMRSLVSIYFFPRLLIYAVTIDQIPLNVTYNILVFLYMACSILIALAQPYRKQYMNIADTLILANLALLSLILSQLSGEQPNTFLLFFYTSGGILVTLPLLIQIGVLIWKMIRKVTKLSCCKRLLQSIQRNKHNFEGDNQLTQSSESHEYHEFKELVVSVVSVMEYDEYQS